MDCDLLIENADVVDGTGRAPFTGHVAVSEGEIARVLTTDDPAVTARETLDAEGLVVAPGFIDVHTHSDLAILTESGVPASTRQGVTTQIVGLDGFSVAPLYSKEEWGHGPDRWKDFVSPFVGSADVDWDWKRTSDYFDAIESNGIATNVGMLVGHGTIRYNVLGTRHRAPSPEELEQIGNLVEHELNDGALGVSTATMYPPQQYADPLEFEEIAERLSPQDKPLVITLGESVSEAEALLDDVRSRSLFEEVPVHVTQLQPLMSRDSDWVDDVVAEVPDTVTFDHTVYNYTVTALSKLLPPWVLSFEKSIDENVENLTDDGLRDQLRDRFDAPGDPAASSIVSEVGWDRISVRDSANNEVRGKSIPEIAEDRDDDPVDVVFDLLIEDEFATSILVEYGDDNFDRFLSRERMAVTSDTEFGDHPHPRSSGTFPKLLDEYVEPGGPLSIERAVYKITKLPADVLSLPDKGTIEEGTDADVTIFDREAVASNADVSRPQARPDGISHVIVDGEFVLRNGRATDATPGEVLRG